MSPLATLDRGYAIVSAPDGHVLLDATEARPGDTIEARLARGRLSAHVLVVHPATQAPAESE